MNVANKAFYPALFVIRIGRVARDTSSTDNKNNRISLI